MRLAIENEIQDALKRKGKTALIVHYVGKCVDFGNGDLILGDRLGTKFARTDLLLGPMDTTELAESAPIDVLFIFDCFFGCLATRPVNFRSRIVEVIAANDERNPVALSTFGAPSFISNLHMELRSRALRGDKCDKISDLISSLEPKSRRQPMHSVIVGMGSMVLSLNNVPGLTSSLNQTSLTTPSS